MFKPGHTYWESFEVYIPTSLTLPTTGWIGSRAIVYGLPYAGSPPANISIQSGNFRFQRNGYGPTRTRSPGRPPW